MCLFSLLLYFRPFFICCSRRLFFINPLCTIFAPQMEASLTRENLIKQRLYLDIIQHFPTFSSSYCFCVFFLLTFWGYRCREGRRRLSSKTVDLLMPGLSFYGWAAPRLRCFCIFNQIVVTNIVAPTKAAAATGASLQRWKTSSGVSDNCCKSIYALTIPYKKHDI